MLPLRNLYDRYGWIAMILHWFMAVLILGMLGIGLYMSGLPNSPDKLKLYGLHKSFGTLVLGLAVVRLCWRNANFQPPLPSTMPWIQRIAAHGAHHLLYFFMLALPITGWLMSSAAGFPVSVFGQFTLPNLIDPNPDLRKLFSEAHELLAYGLMVTLAAHIGAGLFHHYVQKDDILRRMLP